jgi:hypothetical protein
MSLDRVLRRLVTAVFAVTVVAIGVVIVQGNDYFRETPFVAFAMWIVMPGLVVYLHPRMSIALLWSAIAWFGFLMAFNLSWPAPLVAAVMAPVIAVLLFGIPLYATIRKLVAMRAERLARPEPPVARVVTRRRP